MKNKFVGAAIIGGIATVLASFLATLLNTLVIQMMSSSSVAEVRVLILVMNISETSMAMFVGIKAYCAIIKKCANKSKTIVVSLIAGAVKSLLLFFIPLPISALGYVISFVVLFLFSLVITNSNLSEVRSETKNEEATQKTSRPVANEEMSAKAQYAYNEKLQEFQNTGRIVDEEVEAKLFAQAVELQLLKSPASAKFCSVEEMTIVRNGDVYIVSGYVDSQNSYGAMVRTPFKVTVFNDQGTWKDADKIIGMSASIGAQVISHTLIYWIIGIILSLASFAFFYFIISSQFGF